MIKVLILNGPAESGKGTVAEYLRKIFDLNIREYSSIDYVKYVAKESFGWDSEKDVAGRNLLSAIKQTMISYNNLPTKKVIEEIKIIYVLHKDMDMLIVDIREPDEIEKLVEYCKSKEIVCHTCRIHNVTAEKKAKKSGLSLTGDRLYGEYDYDIHLKNNGSLKELKHQVAIVFGSLYNIISLDKEIRKNNVK